MKQSERPSNEKGGAPQGEVHTELIDEILALTDEEVLLVTRLLTSLRI